MPLNRVQFEQEIVCRRILYFSTPELNTPEPHYFICLCRQVDIANFSCCTSQFETVRRLIERHRFQTETLVYISEQDNDNPFDRQTYINCNEWWPFSIEELWDKYNNSQLTIINDLLPLHSFEQILIGLRVSNKIEEELKDALPNIDDL